MEKKRSLIGGMLIALVILVVLLLAYTPPEGGQQASGEVRLAAADNGRTIELTTGQIVIITLEANPTTGYTWEVAGVPGGQVMRHSSWTPMLSVLVVCKSFGLRLSMQVRPTLP